MYWYKQGHWYDYHILIFQRVGNSYGYILMGSPLRGEAAYADSYRSQLTIAIACIDDNAAGTILLQWIVDL